MPFTGSRLAGLVLGALVVLGIAGCGGESETRSPTWFAGSGTDGRNAAADATAPGARDFLVQLADAQTSAQSVTMDITMSVAGEEIVAHGQTRVGEDPADVEMSMTMEMPGLGTMEMRFVDGVMYLSLGAESDDTFVAIDADDELFGDQLTLMLEQMDPAVQMELMKDALLDLRQEGDAEQIDGVEAVPYVVVMDAAAVVEASGATAEELEGAELPETIESTIYVGPDNLLRRMAMDVMGMEMTMDFSAWGQDVVIEAPGPEQIFDGDAEDLFSDAA